MILADYVLPDWPIWMGLICWGIVLLAGLIGAALALWERWRAR